MEMSRFSVFEAIVYAFRTVLDNIRLFVFAALAKIAFFLVYFLIFGLISMPLLEGLWNLRPQFMTLFKCSSVESCRVAGMQVWSACLPLFSQYLILGIVFAILLMFFGIAIYLGFIRLVLTLHDTGRSSVKLLFSCFGLAPKTFISLILYGLMVGVGFMLFIIPGVYLALRGLFFTYFIVDKNAGIIDSIKRSFDATRNQGWPLFALLFLAPMILQFGPVGVLIITPLMTSALVHVYRKLTA